MTSLGIDMLATENLTIRFGGHAAVDGVSCAFGKGTLTSIVGPTDYLSKTTYFNLISGQLPATSGRVTLNGEDITNLAAPRRTRLGLGRAFQLTNLFPNLSMLETWLAVQVKSGKGYDLFSRTLTHRELIDRAMAHLEAVSLADQADDRRDPATRRPAQARGRDPAGARARRLHVR